MSKYISYLLYTRSKVYRINFWDQIKNWDWNEIHEILLEIDEKKLLNQNWWDGIWNWWKKLVKQNWSDEIDVMRLIEWNLKFIWNIF